jgi:ABC-2 type transport system permease protein
MFIPFYLGSSIAQAPNGPLAVTLSMIPFSAPVAMMLRLTSTTVPTWQLASSVTLLLVFGLGMIALMARVFKAQTLLSGEEISVKKFLQALA